MAQQIGNTEVVLREMAVCLLTAAALGDVFGAVAHGLLHAFAAMVELLGIRRLDVECLGVFDGLHVGTEEEELPA